MKRFLALGCFSEPSFYLAIKAPKPTGGLAHSVCGFLNGIVAKRMRLKLVSAKSEDGERRYTVQR